MINKSNESGRDASPSTLLGDGSCNKRRRNMLPKIQATSPESGYQSPEHSLDKKEGIKAYNTAALWSEEEVLEYELNTKNFIQVVTLSDLKKGIKAFRESFIKR